MGFFGGNLENGKPMVFWDVLGRSRTKTRTAFSATAELTASAKVPSRAEASWWGRNRVGVPFWRVLYVFCMVFSVFLGDV